MREREAVCIGYWLSLTGWKNCSVFHYGATHSRERERQREREREKEEKRKRDRGLFWMEVNGAELMCVHLHHLRLAVKRGSCERHASLARHFICSPICRHSVSPLYTAVTFTTDQQVLTSSLRHLVFDPRADRKVMFCTARKWHHFVKAFNKRTQRRPTATSQSRCYCKRHSETKHKPAFRLRSVLSFLPHWAVMWQCRISQFIEHPRTPRPSQILFISLRLLSITADTWKARFDRTATFSWCGSRIVGQ